MFALLCFSSLPVSLLIPALRGLSQIKAPSPDPGGWWPFAHGTTGGSSTYLNPLVLLVVWTSGLLRLFGFFFFFFFTGPEGPELEG